MHADSHARWRELLALEALGRIEPDERRELAAHLGECAACRAEGAELARIAEALFDPEVDLRNAPALDDPPAYLEERVLERARASRRAARRRRFALRGGLAAATAIAAVLTIVALRPSDPAAPPTEPITFALVPRGVEADASLIAHTWGTEVELVVTGLPAGARYTVQFVGRDGRPVPAGTFIGVSGRPVVCRMNSALLRADARELVVRGAGGGVLMRAALA
jgi:anti-sigma factor RsiW